MVMEAAFDRLAEVLEKTSNGLILVITGAGVSLASGIPTFRGSDEGAVWNNDVLEMGTDAYFRRDPVGSWQWSLKLFDKIVGAEPNPAHQAIAALERWQLDRGGRFLLVTQNIDTLHEKAGSRELVKVHGTVDRVRCARVGCRHGAPYGSLARSEVDMEAFTASPSRETLPLCPECGSLVRQHVLWFDEYYSDHEDYQWRRTQQAAEMAHVVLFAGTSFAVGVTELAVQYAGSVGIPIFSVDPAAHGSRSSGITPLRARAEELLPALCQRLGA